MAQQQVTGFVLAGGRSSRMGRDKAALSLDGRTLLEHALEIVRSICPQVFILGSQELYGSYGPVIEDIFPGCGPLGGIHAALSHSPTRFNLILAVDTPFIKTEFLAWLVEKAAQSQAVVTAPSLQGFMQPLCAVYAREFLPIAEAALKSGNYKIVPLFPEGKTTAVTEKEMARFAFTPEMFENLNTPEDFQRAKERTGGPHS
jgi:molybdopterin-guanine dinucleotide biosynthesis protein A